MRDFTVIRKIGRGKYSEVFEGMRLSTRQHCCIKVLKPVREVKVGGCAFRMGWARGESGESWFCACKFPCARVQKKGWEGGAERESSGDAPMELAPVAFCLFTCGFALSDREVLSPFRSAPQLSLSRSI